MQQLPAGRSTDRDRRHPGRMPRSAGPVITGRRPVFGKCREVGQIPRIPRAGNPGRGRGGRNCRHQGGTVQVVPCAARQAMSMILPGGFRRPHFRRVQRASKLQAYRRSTMTRRQVRAKTPAALRAQRRPRARPGLCKPRRSHGITVGRAGIAHQRCRGGQGNTVPRRNSGVSKRGSPNHPSRLLPRPPPSARVRICPAYTDSCSRFIRNPSK